MRSNRAFWSLVLILVGVLLLLGNLGLLPPNVWPLIWPSLLILAGLWVLSSRLFRTPVETQSLDVPLGGAGEARLTLSHGAGRIRVSGAAAPGMLVSGQFTGGVVQRLNRTASLVELELSADIGRGMDFPFPWIWGPTSALDWTLGLSSEVPLSLEVRTGASELSLDLTDLKLKDLRLETGASSSEILLPERAGMTRASIKGGATSVRLHVPSGVAARIASEGGLAEFKVDTARFPRTDRGYQSTDYATADNKVEIRVEVGLSSVSIT